MNDVSTDVPPITLSTVTPVYSGAKYLKELVEQLAIFKLRLEETQAPLRLIEAIFSDDGSVDASAEELRRLQKQYTWIRVVTLSRNYGQHAATVAGILHATGDWVATLITQSP